MSHVDLRATIILESPHDKVYSLDLLLTDADAEGLTLTETNVPSSVNTPGRAATWLKARFLPMCKLWIGPHISARTGRPGAHRTSAGRAVADWSVPVRQDDGAGVVADDAVLAVDAPGADCPRYAGHGREVGYP
jgi:hypothetical protein